MNMPHKPCKAEAQRFLDALEPGGVFTFQVFDDDQDRKSQELRAVLHGTLQENRFWAWQGV